jgi:hypothetical protein
VQSRGRSARESLGFHHAGFDAQDLIRRALIQRSFRNREDPILQFRSSYVVLAARQSSAAHVQTQGCGRSNVCQSLLDCPGEDRYHLGEEVIAFDQMADEIRAQFKETDDVMTALRRWKPDQLRLG